MVDGISMALLKPTCFFLCLLSSLATGDLSTLHRKSFRARLERTLANKLFHTGEHVGEKVVPEFASTTCPGNAYFIDWGSTGMKVYRVHGSQYSNAALSNTEEALFIREVGPDNTTDEVKAIFHELADRLEYEKQQGGKSAKALLRLNSTKVYLKGSSGINKGTLAADGPLVFKQAIGQVLNQVPSDGEHSAVLATAGMRTIKAERLWKGIRKVAAKMPFLFKKCNEQVHDDCKTIPGSREAELEVASVLHTSLAKELQESKNKKFAFASAGGASLQIGIAGPNSTLMQCAADLDLAPKDLDKEPIKVALIEGNSMLVLSFLAVADPKCAGDGSSCDNYIGGTNTMRAAFDNFLLKQGNTKNPCLQGNLHPQEDCPSFLKSARKCTVDRHGGMLSRLPGAGDKDQCRERVKEFMSKDRVLQLWSQSEACKALAEGADLWAFAGGFSRKTQLGSDIDNWKAFRQVLADSNQLGVDEGGVLLTSTLLCNFLEHLGVKEGAQVHEAKAEWALEAMTERHLLPGWVECSWAG